jgi:DNA repair photolyase
VSTTTNVDCYQRAEGRYQLMRGVLSALRDAANPFSILTKGALILRDLDLLEQAAAVTDVSTAVSVGFVDDDLWRSVEPGTPRPSRRLEVCATLNAAGIPCGVLMAPILPFLTDSDAHLERTVRAIAETGATHVTPIVLHLRPGAREWWQAWLKHEHPALVSSYAGLYSERAYAPKGYQQGVTLRVRELAEKHGVGRAGGPRGSHRPAHVTIKPTGAHQPSRPAGAAGQLSLLDLPER